MFKFIYCFTEKPKTTVTTAEKPPSSSSTLMPDDHDAANSNVLYSSNNSATDAKPLVPSSSISSLQASKDQHEKPDFSINVSLFKTSQLPTQSQLQLTSAEDAGQICSYKSSCNLVSEK